MKEKQKPKLSSLLKNNQDFYRLKKQYDNKILVTKSYKIKKDFIDEELQRIKTDFTEPIKIKMKKGDFILQSSFQFDNYIRIAYEALLKGNDYFICDLVSNAERDYLSNEEFGKIYNKDEFEITILRWLELGVAYILYEKHLKNELQRFEKPLWKKTWIVILAIIVFVFTIIDYLNKSFDLWKNIKSLFNFEIKK